MRRVGKRTVNSRSTPMSSSRSVTLRLFGNAALIGADGSRLGGPAAQRHRLALLALLAVQGEEGRGREQLLALLWPERDAVHARQLLKQAVYSVRKALGDDALLSAGTDLRLNPTVIRADVAEFETALAHASHAAAVALYRGPFLDGFALPDAPEFERWVDQERGRIAAAYARALEALAGVAEDRQDFAAAVDRWRARAAHDPYDSRVALRLMRALDASGNRAGALQHAALHQRLLQAEFGVQASPELQTLVDRLSRAAPEAPAGRGSGGATAGNGVADQPLGTRASHEPSVAAEPSSVSESAPAVERQSDGLAPQPSVATTELPSHRAFTSSTPRDGASRWRRRPLVYGVGVLALLAGLVGVRLSLARGDREDSGMTAQIAHAVSRELDVRLGAAASRPAQRPTTRNVAAYDLYRRGSDRTRLRSERAAQEGVALLQQAVALDSTYAAAWAALALMHHRVGLVENGPTLSLQAREQHRRLAEQAARQALALDDSLADSHLMMGKVRMADFDLASAERHLAQAVALDRTLPEPHELLVTLSLWRGRAGEALVHAERAVALDSLSPAAHAEVAHALLGLDRCDAALAELEKLSHLRPPLLRIADYAAQCHARMERWADALAVLRPQAERGMPTALAQTAYVLARAGRRREALRIHALLLERARRGGGGAFQVGLAYAGLGDLDQALAWFERARTDHSLHGGPSSPGLMLVLPGPLSADLRRHPGFEPLRERIGLPRLATIGATHPAATPQIARGK